MMMEDRLFEQYPSAINLSHDVDDSPRGNNSFGPKGFMPKEVGKLILRSKSSITEDQITYAFKKGDTLAGLSLRFKTSISSIKRLNHLTSNTIFIGQQLKISQGDATPTSPLTDLFIPGDSKRSSRNSSHTNGSPTNSSTGDTSLNENDEDNQLEFTFEEICPKCNFLKDKYISIIKHDLPKTLINVKWNLLYCLNSDGSSLNTLVSRIATKGPTLFFIQNDCGDIFGSFASVSWKKQTKYFGNGQSFVFKIDQSTDRPIIFRWSKQNILFQYLTEKLIGMGGGKNGFSFNLDDNLHVCISNDCETYNSPTLTSKVLTHCVNLYVFGL